MLTVAWGKRTVTRERDTRRRPRLVPPKTARSLKGYLNAPRM